MKEGNVFNELKGKEQIEMFFLNIDGFMNGSIFDIEDYRIPAMIESSYKIEFVCKTINCKSALSSAWRKDEQQKKNWCIHCIFR